MLIDIAKSRVQTTDRSYEHVRFIYRNGIVAVWKDDFEEAHSTRLLRIPDVKFIKRRKRSDPHLVVSRTTDDVLLSVWPIQAGGCNCGSRAKRAGITYDNLTAENFDSF